ncbi:MAG: B12-binding domain-containing radical SAM protein [Deltaproteobacteria bacterium]|nr:B12-binding domain-containing radical SAM protein [Deltaproteobacteria bacterium]
MRPLSPALATLPRRPRVLLSTSPFEVFFGRSFPYVPSGLATLAASVDAAGYPVRFINPDSLAFPAFGASRDAIDPAQYEKNLFDPSFFAWQKLEAFLRTQAFDVFGISVMISQFAAAHELARLAKRVNPRAVIVMGGIGVTVKPELAFSEGATVDYVIRGEGEVSFVALLAALCGHGRLEGIPGLSRRSDGPSTDRTAPALLPDLDRLPFPAKHLYLPLSPTDRLPPAAYGRLFASRGCPYRCTYCDSNKLWTRKPRFHGPEYVVEQLRELRARFGVRLVVFDDDTFALDRHRTAELLERLRRARLDVVWRCETRANLVTSELLRAMKRAGCRSITLGIESGSPRTIARVKKGTTREEMLEAARLIKSEGLLLNAFFMFGFPWETEDDFRQTLEMVHRVDANGEVGSVHSYFIPYPGTELHEELRRAGELPTAPLHQLHHHNASLRLAKGIPPARYPELTAEIDRTLARLNLRTRSRLGLTHPRYFLLNLEQRGYLARRFLLGAARGPLAALARRTIGVATAATRAPFAQRDLKWRA